MAIGTDPRTLRRYGRVFVLLGLRNELRVRGAPAWRRERNRLEIDRAIAELARSPGREPAGRVNPRRIVTKS